MIKSKFTEEEVAYILANADKPDWISARVLGVTDSAVGRIRRMHLGTRVKPANQPDISSEPSATHLCSNCRRLKKDALSNECPKETQEYPDIGWFAQKKSIKNAKRNFDGLVVYKCPFFIEDRKDGQRRSDYERELQERLKRHEIYKVAANAKQEEKSLCKG